MTITTTITETAKGRHFTVATPVYACSNDNRTVTRRYPALTTPCVPMVATVMGPPTHAVPCCTHPDDNDTGCNGATLPLAPHTLSDDHSNNGNGTNHNAVPAAHTPDGNNDNGNNDMGCDGGYQHQPHTSTQSPV